MVNNLKKISVILPIYKEPITFIKASINSIINQTYKNLELIIIVDNPDITDEFRKILHSFAYFDNRIKVYYNINNIGLAMSLNRGIKISEGEYIARMDADDVSLEERLEKEIEYCELNNIDIVSTNMASISSEGSIIKRRYNLSLNPEKTLPYFCSIYHPTIMMKRKILDSFGVYQDIRISEDYELWLRFLRAGVKFGVIDKVLLHYRVRNNSLIHNNEYKSRRAYEYIISSYKHNKKSNKYFFSIADYNHYITEYVKSDEKKFLFSIHLFNLISKNKNIIIKADYIFQLVTKTPKWTLILLYEKIRNFILIKFYNIFLYANRGSN